MSQPYVGEVRMFAGNFAPFGWALCQGQTMPIDQYPALFNLIGTTYGGDGQQTFNLPNLQSRVPLHMGSLSGGANYTIGQTGGAEKVTVNVNQLAAHTHFPMANAGNGGSSDPTNNFWAGSAAQQFNAASGAQMATGAMTNTGGSQPHDNMLPYLCINFIIALEGIYPTQ